MDPLGDESEGQRVTIPLTTQGTEVDQIVDIPHMPRRRGVAIPMFVDVPTLFDEALAPA